MVVHSPPFMGQLTLALFPFVFYQLFDESIDQSTDSWFKNYPNELYVKFSLLDLGEEKKKSTRDQ